MPPLSAFLPILFIVSLGLLLRHFLGSLAWACLLAVITWPLHERLQRRGWTPLASAAALLSALVLSFSGPSIFLFNTLSNEVSTVERLLGQLNQTGVPAPQWIVRLPLVARPVLTWWQEHLAVPGGLNTLIRTTAGDLIPHLTSTVSTLGPTILANALYLFLAMLTLFVLYVEGPTVVKYVDRAGLRVAPNYYAVLRRLFPLSVRGTALGLCSVALLEGVVLGIAYTIAGAPAPVLLAVITGYMALIPGGAPLSFTLVSLLLLGQGHAGAALGLFSWGVFELFLVDKFVRPKLIGRRVELPFLAVLFWWLRGGRVDAVVAEKPAQTDDLAV